MNDSFNRLSTCLLVLCFWLSGPAFCLDLYVAPHGSDKNPGTIHKPFASLEAAQLKARKSSEPVNVFVRAGMYYLAKPIVFTPQDSRKADSKLTFKPYQNEKVLLSGAKPLALKWTRQESNIYKAKVAGDVSMDQLYADGQLLRMARYPNYDASSSHFGGYSEDVLAPERIKKWKNPEGAFIHSLHSHEWGGYHYKVVGKETDGTLKLEGGYQNNRQMGMHKKYRFIENVFEELDAPGEWYYDHTDKNLYVFIPNGQDPNRMTWLTPQLKSLVEFRGDAQHPVRNISIEGFELAHVQRTFMDTKEPLLRSDWTIYRGGTVVLEGTENCSIRNCHFKEVGGNAVFFSNYNRQGEVSGCHIEGAGASGICFVGDPKAVRSPSFEYHQFVDLQEMDRKPGPKSNNYPAECRVSDNLMHDLGKVEKQVAGVQISMAMDIAVSHNSIYNVPRSGINVSEGTWGGHLIEYNDVFNTVLETGDHGAFNSWGRDRFWHPNRKTMDKIVAEHPEMILLDVQKTITIRNNRFRCDHGWDIDLDDGSSNYHIYNNVCLNGGLKLREGFQRVVENNIMLNNSFHPHVWFANSGDVFRKNIVTKPYFPIRVNDWGQEVNSNLFPDVKALEMAQKNRTDSHSLAGAPLFIDADHGDYRVQPNSPALKIGFKNFDMDTFGVTSPHLKHLASQPPLPVLQQRNASSADSEANWLGGQLRNVSGLGDRSAFGLPDELGVVVEAIKADSPLGKSGLQNGDVIRKMEQQEVRNMAELMDRYQEINWKGHAVVEIFRNQAPLKLDISFK